MANLMSSIPTRKRIAGFDLFEIQQSRVYDVLMRVPLLAWSLGSALVAAQRLAAYERDADPMLPDALYAVHIAMQLAMIAFLLTVAGTVLVRARPTGKARGIEPRISALIGSWLKPVIVFFERRDL